MSQFIKKEQKEKKEILKNKKSYKSTRIETFLLLTAKNDSLKLGLPFKIVAFSNYISSRNLFWFSCNIVTQEISL